MRTHYRERERERERDRDREHISPHSPGSQCSGRMHYNEDHTHRPHEGERPLFRDSENAAAIARDTLPRHLQISITSHSGSQTFRIRKTKKIENCTDLTTLPARRASPASVSPGACPRGCNDASRALEHPSFNSLPGAVLAP